MARKRKHTLYIGEIVFDDSKHLFGVITDIDKEKGIYTLDMTARGTIRPYFNCESENREMFDEELTDDELVWTCDDEYQLYQIAWNIIDCRWGELVCYEHQKTMDNYPYYSPYLEENLFNIEVEKIKE